MDSVVPESSSVKKRKNVSFACQNCRRRRTKCDGERPCGRCARSDVPCTYDSDADGRTKRSRRQNIAGLENDSYCLRLILENARSGDEGQISNLIDRLKIAESTADLEEWLKDQLSDTDSPHIKLSPDPTNEISLRSLSRELQLEESGLIDPELLATSSTLLPDTVTPKVDGSELVEDSRTVGLTDYQFNSVLIHTRYRNNIVRAVMASRNWHSALCADLSEEDVAQLLQDPRNPTSRGKRPSSQSATSEDDQLRTAYSSSDVEHVSRGLGWASDIRTNGFASAIQTQQLRILEQPEWSILPLSFNDQSPLCRAYVSFWHAAKMAISEGTPVQEILGAGRLCVDLFFQRRPKHPESHDVSYWANSIVSSFDELEAASRLRSILLCYQLMQWMIIPSPETYASLAICQRPTIAQRLIPHSATVDLFVHQPELRTGLCQNPRDFLTLAANNSVNWTKTIDEAVETDEHGSLYMTPEFEAHALSTGRWTYTSNFIAAFPELEGLVRVRDH